MENKLNIHVAGEKLLLGNDYVILNDETDATYFTNNLDEFIPYVNKAQCKIFVGDNSVEAFDDLEDYNYQLKPFAVCSIGYHPIVALLKNNNGTELGLSDFAIFLDRIKNYLTANSLKLRDNIADLKLRKVLSIEHQNDRRGNFNFTVRSETQGKQDYEFPKELDLKIPVVINTKSEKNILELSFNFFFKWKMVDENASLLFMMENIEFNILVEDAKSEIITEHLRASIKDGKDKIIQGHFEIYPQTDQWKYHKNDVKITDYKI